MNLGRKNYNMLMTQIGIFVAIGPSDYEEEPEEDERLADVRAVVSNLSPQYRGVFDLYSQGYKHKEIAKLLNISVGTSKSNLFKAKANINKYLANKPSL